MNNRTSRVFRAAACTGALACAALLARGATDPGPSADALYKDAVHAYQQQNYSLALSTFKSVESKYPDSKHAIRCLEYMAQCENKLGNPFGAFSLPEAILKFRQGVRRLIRTTTDRGIIVVLDNRILTKRYGQAFLDAVPKCPVEIV